MPKYRPTLITYGLIFTCTFLARESMIDSLKWAGGRGMDAKLGPKGGLPDYDLVLAAVYWLACCALIGAPTYCAARFFAPRRPKPVSNLSPKHHLLNVGLISASVMAMASLTQALDGSAPREQSSLGCAYTLLHLTLQAVAIYESVLAAKGLGHAHAIYDHRQAAGAANQYDGPHPHQD